MGAVLEIAHNVISFFRISFMVAGNTRFDILTGSSQRLRSPIVYWVVISCFTAAEWYNQHAKSMSKSCCASPILEGIWPWILLSSIIDSISINICRKTNGWIRVLSFMWNTGWQYEMGCNPPILVVPTVKKFWPSLLPFWIFVQHLAEGSQSRSRDSPCVQRVRVGVLCLLGGGRPTGITKCT